MIPIKFDALCLIAVIVYFDFSYKKLAKKTGKERTKYVQEIGKMIKAETYTTDTVFVDEDGIIICWLFPKLLTEEDEGCIFFLWFNMI